MGKARYLSKLASALSAEGSVPASNSGIPTISSISYGGDDTATDPAGGKTITLTGTGFAAGAKVLINLVQVSVVSVVSSTQITFTAPALAAGSYVLYVVNADGSTAIAVPGIQYSGVPAWTTSAGTLATQYESTALTTTVAATSNSAVTYSLFSGTLPPGTNIASNGTISGTTPLTASPTTYTFVLRATDAENQDTDRTFSLIINPDVVTWSSPVNAATLTAQLSQAYSSTLTATAGSGNSISYTANTLPTGLSLSGNTISGTPTVSGTSSTTLTATSANTAKTAQITINWTVNLAVDANWPYTTLLLNAENTSVPFATDASTNNFAVSVVGDARPTNFSPHTPGYYSNYFDGTGDYLSTTVTAQSPGSGDFTYECWFNVTNYTSARYLWNTRSGDTSDGFDIQIQTNGQVAISYTGTLLFSSTAVVLASIWNHIAVVRAGTTWTVYLNGISIGTFTNSTNFTSTTLFVGAAALAGSPFLGYISNFRYTKGTAVYTAAFTPSTTPLTTITGTQLLTCQSNRFIDNSSNAFTITRNGDVAVKAFDPFPLNPSYATYGSTYFDGNGDYLVVGDATIINGDFSAEMWVNIPSLPAASTDYFILGSTTTNTFDGISITSAGLVKLHKDGVATPLTSVSAILPNTWNHILFTRSSGTERVWLNGVYQASRSQATYYFALNVLGRVSYTGYTYYFTGYMADVRILSYALYNTNANFTSPTQPLTAVTNTSLLTCQTNQPTNNSQFIDSSTNSFDINRFGNTTQGTFSPYGGNWSNYFDGTGDYLSVPNNLGLDFQSSNFTAECWIYPIAFDATDGTFMGIGQQSGSASWGIVGLANGSLQFSAWSSGTTVGITFNSAANAITFNTWNHVAITRNSNTWTIWANGISVATTTNTTTIGNTGRSAFICYGFSSGAARVQNAYISNVRWVKGTAVYTANFTPSTTPLTVIPGTQLLTCQSHRFVDNSGNNFTLTKTGDVSIQKFSPFSTLTESTPQSYSNYFDGVSPGDYLSVPHNAALNLSSGDFTVEAWVWYVNTSSQTPIFFNKDGISGTAYPGWQLNLQYPSTQYVLTAYVSAAGGSAGQQIQSSTGFPLNQWVHVAFVRSGTTLTIYQNGVNVASATQTSAIVDAGRPLYIGYEASAALTACMVGHISNARVVKGTAVYTSNFTPATTPLTAIANTSLLTCQDATFRDNSANAFTVTAFGDARPSKVNPFGYNAPSTAQEYSTSVFGGSAYFDGSGDYLSIPDNDAFAYGTSNFTFECWIYPTVAGDRRFYSQYQDSSNQCLIRLNAANTIAFNFILGAGTVISLTSSTTVPLSAWTHVAVVRNGNTFTMYLNGVSSTSGSSNGTMPNYVASLLISSYDGTNEQWIGYLSGMRVVKGEALYTSNFLPANQPLTPTAKTILLLNNTCGAIADKSGKVVLETVGDARVSTVQKKYGTGALYFDGTGDYLFVPGAQFQNFNFGTGDYTIECWLYQTAFNLDTVIIASFTTWSSSVNFYLGTRAGTPNILIFRAGDSIPITLNGNTGITVNTWTHIAVTRASGVTRLFVNGVTQTATHTGSVNLGSTVQAVGIGAANNASEPITGYIDDLRITKGAARYTSNFTPPTGALSAK